MYFEKRIWQLVQIKCICCARNPSKLIKKSVGRHYWRWKTNFFLDNVQGSSILFKWF